MLILDCGALAAIADGNRRFGQESSLQLHQELLLEPSTGSSSISLTQSRFLALSAIHCGTPDFADLSVNMPLGRFLLLL